MPYHYAYTYTYMQRHFRLSLLETTQARHGETLATAVLLHVQYSESACSVCTGYVFFGTLVLKEVLHDDTKLKTLLEVSDVIIPAATLTLHHLLA